MDFEELSEELDLEQWFDHESLAYKMTRGRSGMQINARTCPECGDDRYRVYLNAETGVGNCFICNTTFRKLSYVHKTLGARSWGDTLAHVKEALKEQGWRPKRRSGVAVNIDKVKLPLSFPLPTLDGENLAYLEKRGVDCELTGYFHLRYCDDGWWNFTKDDGSKGGQHIERRVIIPVFDLDGELATFQARDITGSQDPKYLFPKQLPGTGKFIYNGQNAWGCRRLVLGEGAFDVIAIKKAIDGESALRDFGVGGTFGKHLSYGDPAGDDQLGRLLQLKRRGLKEVVMMYDGEVKALNAALEACQQIVKVGLQAKVALLPIDKDPNEVPSAIVRKAIWEAMTWTPALHVRLRVKNPYKRRAFA